MTEIEINRVPGTGSLPVGGPMQYRLLSESSPNDLSENVTQYLQAGWRLYGEPVATMGKNALMYNQAVVHD